MNTNAYYLRRYALPLVGIVAGAVLLFAAPLFTGMAVASAALFKAVTS